MNYIDKIITGRQRLTLGGAPEGFDALVLADLVRRLAGKASGGPCLLHITRDDARMESLAETIAFFGPEIDIRLFPAWDCLPYDRVSPQPEITARRIGLLHRLATDGTGQKPAVILTTINAVLQRLPAQDSVAQWGRSLRQGDRLDLSGLSTYLTDHGYSRASQVMESGEFTVRGGLIDVFAPGTAEPVRIDLFGDEIDSIRTFDPLNQRTSGAIENITLLPASEFSVDPESIRRFRQGYVSRFGTVTEDDPLYQAISDGRRYQGAEHWLPLFHGAMETLFDYLPEILTTMDHQAGDAANRRLEAIADYFQARSEKPNQELTLKTVYKPLDKKELYLNKDEWQALVHKKKIHLFSPFRAPETGNALDLGGRIGRDFAPERTQKNANIYDAVRAHIVDLKSRKQAVVLANYSAGARERMINVLGDHGVAPVTAVDSWQDVARLSGKGIGAAIVPLEHGFEAGGYAFLTEQDILGDRLARKARRARRAENFLTEAAALSPGDLVVHVNHGIGRFDRLEAVRVSGADHDCLRLIYDGGDRLYVPVENIEMLSRYGSDGSAATLDKLGGAGWQARKARLKQRIREMADELIKIAALRALKKSPVIRPAPGLYDEFCARFPYTETDDQLRSIGQVLDDLNAGKPMDRLVCGDVGFGKTEVALRAAFATVMAGYQVAVIAPTTLLARQHYKTFTERFSQLPVRIEQLSRLVSAKSAAETRNGLTDGQVDIVIGTHALLGKAIKFRELGLLVVDEEQHFGVAHKETLKKLRADMHVLTLTATPIPRTLQLALSGIRDLSLIATPPVDRLAVRTFILPFDEMVIREALLREHYRGGQSFFVCPRIADLEQAREFLREQVPEVKAVMAYGRMPPSQIEDAMTAFYDRKYDVLLSTAIVESGLDIPTANTLIIHRADMFGLSQLYQLRGRVGRSKVRAYAYMTTMPNGAMTEAAHKRLEVLQTLDTLGAGFTLASHDMDIRGSGNLLGEEQSGHIREVGIELYQKMLEDAVAEAQADGGDVAHSTDWSPQINIGASVLIPEAYVPDLSVRMALYRRLGDLRTREEIDGFAAELVDRFGPLPAESKHLLSIVEIKIHCINAGIDRIEAGPKGATFAFRDGRFANPAGLVELISSGKTPVKLRPDHKLVLMARWDDVERRLTGTLQFVRSLDRIANESAAA